MSQHSTHMYTHARTRTHAHRPSPRARLSCLESQWIQTAPSDSAFCPAVCVFDVCKQGGGLSMIEIAEGFGVDDVRAATGAAFSVADDLRPMLGA